ncbi:MAG: Scr1 family TA system antitoxin-like transcriptional regulator, partial [bacterium]
ARQTIARADLTGKRDVAAATRARMERQSALYEPGRRFEFLLGEPALRRQVGAANVMQAQLDRIVSAATLEQVTIGVLPLTGTAQIDYGFGIYTADVTVAEHLELPHALLTLTDPKDVQTYEQLWKQLTYDALFDEEAGDFIRRVASEVAEG